MNRGKRGETGGIEIVAVGERVDGHVETSGLGEDTAQFSFHCVCFPCYPTNGQFNPDCDDEFLSNAAFIPERADSGVVLLS